MNRHERGYAMLTITIQPGEGAIARAINALPQDDAPAVIRLTPGVYREKVELRRPHTTLEGAGADQCRIVWADGGKYPHPDGRNTGTFRSYTLLVLADDCRLTGLTVENAARPRQEAGQSIALFADGDGFVCEDCTLLSCQDTLFTAPLPPREVIPGGFLGPTQLLPRKPQRQIYRRCVIKGDVDFIFGGAAAWFEDCDVVSIHGATDGSPATGYATAASTPQGQKYGYVFRNCHFLGEGVPDGAIYLGRPWREYAKTVLLHCHIGPHIRPEGWHDWDKPAFHTQGFYAEYGCTGPGSHGQRAPFVRTLTPREAEAITLEDFMASLG